MKKRFGFGKILVHMARYGIPLPASARKFWAKSYGESAMREGDIVRVTIQHETRRGLATVMDTVNAEWKVVEVKGAGFDWTREFLTTFEPTSFD